MENQTIRLIGTADFLSRFMKNDLHKSATELYDYACALIEKRNLDWTTVMQAAAEKGHPEAAFTMGTLILNNPGCPFTEEDAVRFFSIASNQGHAEASTNLAICYTIGRGVAEDQEHGFSLLQKASEQGDIMADFNIAQGYIFGVGVKQDIEKGIKMLYALSEDGVAEATELLYKLRDPNHFQ